MRTIPPATFFCMGILLLAYPPILCDYLLVVAEWMNPNDKPIYL